MEQIRLSAEDRALAVAFAEARQAEAKRLGRRDAYGASGGLALHIDGTLTELAFARMLGVPLDRWTAYVETPDLRSIPSDVDGWQVRGTRARPGHLLIHPSDPDQRFVLIRNACPTFTAVGWLPSPAEAKREDWWRRLNPRQAAAWCVPADALVPFTLEAAL